MIPNARQFRILFERNYKYNLQLFGKPLEKPCSYNKESAKRMAKDGENMGNTRDFNNFYFIHLIEFHYFDFLGFIYL